MSESVETMPVGSWAVAQRGVKSVVVFREDETHWCDESGRTILSMEGATWSGIRPADPPTPNQNEETGQ